MGKIKIILVIVVIYLVYKGFSAIKNLGKWVGEWQKTKKVEKDQSV